MKMACDTVAFRALFRLGTTAAVGAVLGMCLVGSSSASTQQRVANEGETQYSSAFQRASGGPVIPFFDGWFPNEDGTYELTFGYYNVNTEEVIEIPLGRDNFIEPCRFDGRQPTHFRPVPETDHRYRGVFTIAVPADFGDGDVVWSLSVNGETYSVPGHLTSTAYELESAEQPSRQNAAPTLRLPPSGEEARGPAGVTVGPLRASVGTPLTLDVEAMRYNPQRQDDSRPVQIEWYKHQGPGRVEFSEQRLEVQPAGWERASTRALFSEPGLYVLRVIAYNQRVDFEFFCCWTNGFVRVEVAP